MKLKGGICKISHWQNSSLYSLKKFEKGFYNIIILYIFYCSSLWCAMCNECTQHSLAQRLPSLHPIFFSIMLLKGTKCDTENVQHKNSMCIIIMRQFQYFSVAYHCINNSARVDTKVPKPLHGGIYLLTINYYCILSHDS